MSARTLGGRLATGAVVVGLILGVGATGGADLLGGLERSFSAALAGGELALALGLVFLAGLATSLTPCVYPMIVITVSVFGARQAKSRLEGAKLSTAFVLGMATLFAPLGVGAALTGQAFGSLLASPVVLIGFAVLFVTMASSFFGAFELNLPPALQNKLATVGGGGTGGAFALGFVMAIIAAPCTGPVLAVLLTFIATTQNVVFGGVAFFVYALGLGVLFWLVGTFAVSLPKSGRWLEWVKSFFGIVFLVMAFYYVRDLIPGLSTLVQKDGVWLAGVAGLALVGFGLGAVDLSFHDRPDRLPKAAGVALAVVGVVGAVLWTGALPPGARIAWMESYAEAKALAARDHKPLLVDFGASWCGACGELDRHTFSDARVVAAARRFVAVHVDLSPGKDTPQNRAALAGYAQRGLPLVVLHDREGDEAARLTRFVEAEEFLRMIERVD